MKRKLFFERLLTSMLAAGLILNSLPVYAEEAGDGAMGRYLETDVALPEPEGGGLGEDMVRTNDGGLRVALCCADGVQLWDSKDGGESWELAAALPEAYAEFYFVELALCADGGGAGVGMIQKGLWNESGAGSEAKTEEEEAETSIGWDDYEYYFISFDAEGNAQARLLEDSENIGSLAFSRGGRLIATSYGGNCMILDRTDGSVLNELSDMTNRIAACGEEALLLKPSELQRYDLESGDPLERDQALEEALFAGGASYEVVSSTGSPIVFAEDEEGRFYYCTANGIYSHTMGGSTVEQVVDGSLNSISDPTLTLVAMEVVDGSFYLLCADGNMNFKLQKYTFDESISSVPQRELTVYSLEENSGIRQAAVTFQKMYPDTYVNYEVGMSGEDGITVSDALRTLNTDILAGNGPDLLVMDGMSVGTYIGKGMLTDLSGIINEIQESDGLLENIARTWQQEDVLPAVPVRFGIPMVAGDREIVNSTENMNSLMELAAEPGVLNLVDVAQIAEILYYTCAGSWKQEDNTINQELLMEYVNSVKQIYDVYMENAKEDEQQNMQYYWENLASLQKELGMYPGYLGSGTLSLLGGSCKVQTGVLFGIEEYAGLTSVNRETGNCQAKLFGGQQSNVFVPICTVGILNTAQEPESAEAFVKYLLSEAGETANVSAGFPVNMAALEKLVYTDPWGEGGGYSVGGGSSDGSDYVELDYSWPSTEELDWLMGAIKELSVRADMDYVQREVVLEEVHRCMTGEIGTEEAVNSIMQKVNLYLAES